MNVDRLKIRGRLKNKMHSLWKGCERWIIIWHHSKDDDESGFLGFGFDFYLMFIRCNYIFICRMLHITCLVQNFLFILISFFDSIFDLVNMGFTHLFRQFRIIHKRSTGMKIIWLRLCCWKHILIVTMLWLIWDMVMFLFCLSGT